MTASQVLDACEQEGISLLVDAKVDIKISAPMGLSPDLKGHNKANKSAVIALLSMPQEIVPAPSPLIRCTAWLERYIKGRYPPLAEVESAAATAGFAAAEVGAALAGPTFVLYKALPRRYVGEVEKVRTIDDWPDDPPLNNRP